MEVNTTFNNMFKLLIVSLKNPNVSLRDRNFVQLEQPALIRPVDVIIKTDTCNLRNGRLQITSEYMKKCNRLQLITITPCLLPRKGWRYNKSNYNKVFKVRPCSGTDWLLNVNIFFQGYCQTMNIPGSSSWLLSDYI
jgi:hypothetical protein